MNKSEQSLLLKFLEGLANSSESEEEEIEAKPYFIAKSEEYLSKLKNRVGLLQSINSFNIGDIVVWKDGLKNKRYPSYEQPCIVIKKNNPPVVDDDPTSNEVFDFQLGFITDDDEFLTFNYDSFRFQLMK